PTAFRRSGAVSRSLLSVTAFTLARLHRTGQRVLVAANLLRRNRTRPVLTEPRSHRRPAVRMTSRPDRSGSKISSRTVRDARRPTASGAGRGGRGPRQGASPEYCRLRSGARWLRIPSRFGFLRPGGLGDSADQHAEAPVEPVRPRPGQELRAEGRDLRE